jgi:competence protein ComEC
MKRWSLHTAHFWETAPFFRLLLPFAAGIFLYDKTWTAYITGNISLIIIAVSFLLFAVSAIMKKSTGPYPLITFTLLNILLFFSGYSISYFTDIRNDTAWFGNNVRADKSYLVSLSDDPVEKENSWKLPVKVIGSVAHKDVSGVMGNAFLYVSKMQPMQWQKGDSLLVPGKWQPIRNAGNPFEFDYANYCRRNNIVYQQFCNPGTIRLYGKNDPHYTAFIDNSHDWCMAQLDKYLPDHKTKGLIQAMLIGDMVNLDQDLLQSYSETGIIHIIAISGGNVAIFFIVISFLMWWLKDKKHLWMKFAIALPLVWFYVLMAGAPPSAVRAALMFSLLAFAVILQKNTNSLNQLFATAFLLLCAQPMWLFSAGFQLSFVAVLSLILFYTPIHKWWSPTNKVAALLWGTVAASIAAEILVAPIVIYYFHTFPLMFIVANVLAYLFMSFVLVLGIAIIVLSFIPIVAKIISICTVWIVTVFDRIVIWLQSLNPASFHFIALKGTELFLLYIVITGISVFFLKKQKASLFIGLGTLCLLMILLCNNKWERLHQRKFVVYNTAHANQIELIQGKYYSIIGKDTSIDAKTAYAVKPAHINWQAWEKANNTKEEVFDVGGKSVLILNAAPINNGDHFPVDYLVINYQAPADPMVLRDIFSPSVIIAGNTFSQKRQERFINSCIDSGIKARSVAESGAFVLN